jgi:uncharacterized protein (TIGR00255 family)
MSVVTSMTGFASGQRELSGGRLVCEIRSVNARFLDLTFRMADEWRAIEPALRELVAERISRGKVECRLAWQRSAVTGPDTRTVDVAALQKLRDWQDSVLGTLPQARQLSVDEALHWPGVLPDTEADPAEQSLDALALTREVLGEFDASRRREGEKLARAIRQALDAVRTVSQNYAARLPELVAAQQQRLTQRLTDALSEAAPGLPTEETAARVRQEVTASGLRGDVTEEVSRLAAHVKEVERVLSAGGPMGKRLDFLCQELNREANTLGSKAQWIDQTRAALDLKLAIEQIREQVQNLE